MRYFPTFNRSLIILLIGQGISGSTVPVLFLISGLMGAQLSPTLILSTLPMSLLVIGIAVSSPIASWTMSKVGRKKGHLLGLFLTILGVALTGISLCGINFWAFCFGNFLTGCGSAFNNQIRFTAAEGSPNQKALVHSWILMFSLFAAFLGPWMIQFGHALLSVGPYTGSLALLFIALLGLMAIMMALPNAQPHRMEQKIAAASINRKEILCQSKFWLPVLAGILSFATMTLLMSATPLQMHTIQHFSKSDTTMIIQSHIIAMFFPSLFSGILLARLGQRKLIVLGIFLFLICIGIAYLGSSCHDYWWSLVLLGVGWNLLFLAGSAGISLTYTGPERFAAQGLNDALVFGTQSIASLSAGWLLFTVGWKTLIMIPLPFLLGFLAFIWVKRV